MLVSDDEAGRDYARAAPLLEQACADEFGAACGSLATMVYLGTGVPAADPQRAMGLAERGCSLRDAQSCAMVGLLLSTGQVSSIDLGRAATALNFACAEGALNACELLENAAALVMQRIDPRVERERALPMFDMACQHGQPRACGMVGAILDEGLMGPADPERGVAAFQRGCTLNHAMSCARLAEAYRVGRGIARDAAQARASAERAIAIDPDNRDAARVLRRLR
jgi:TPR repeat protein